MTSDPYTIMTCGALSLMWDHTEIRSINGQLINPPRFLVAKRNEKQDETRIYGIEWEVAEALAPRDFGFLVNKLNEFRAKRDAEELAQQDKKPAKKKAA
jgi:hypothetical protein